MYGLLAAEARLRTGERDGSARERVGLDEGGCGVTGGPELFAERLAQEIETRFTTR